MINMNEELFRSAMNEKKPVMVEFSAPWCSYCRKIEPALKKVDQQYSEVLTIGQVNIDNEPALAQAEQIELIPTFVIYQDGKALGSIVAPDSKAKIDAFIQEYVK